MRFVMRGSGALLESNFPRKKFIDRYPILANPSKWSRVNVDLVIVTHSVFFSFELCPVDLNFLMSASS